MAQPAAVEIVAIGTELLLGETHETNGTWLGQNLAAAGLAVARRTIVGDEADAIRDAVEQALHRTGTVLCTGGLGPTRDDFTKPVIAALYGRRLMLDAAWLEVVQRRFRDRGIEMAANNRTQAEVPEGAILFPNARGTAPGLALEDPALGLVVLLPGVPSEMRGLVQEHVLPFLIARLTERPYPILSRVLRTTGIAESALGERIDDLVVAMVPLTVSFLPGEGSVDLRITSWGGMPAEEASRSLDREEALLRERLGPRVYGVGDDDLAAVVGGLLREQGFTLAVAESCTGGLLAKRLTDAAGASDFFIAGFVPYADSAKQRFVGVQAETLARHGAVSEQTVSELVEGARIAAGADCALAVTGIAGPGGGTPDKPVGTVWIAAAAGDRVEARRLQFAGDRAEIRARSAQAALALLRRILTEAPE
jgi:nicotinamide-nucleotide amidase